MALALLACGGKAGSDDAKPSGGSGNGDSPETTGPVFQNGIAIGLWVRPPSLVEGEAHLVGDGGGGVTSFQLVLEDGVPVFRLADSNYRWRDLMRSRNARAP